MTGTSPAASAEPVNGAGGDRALRDIESPWNFWAKRFIEAPVYRLCGSRPPHPLATRWRLVLEQDGVRHVIEHDQPLLDAAPIWPSLHSRSWIQASLYELDAETGWCLRVHSLGARMGGGGALDNGTMIGLISKAPDWSEREEPPLDYAASVAQNLDWFERQDESLQRDARDPQLPPWWWYASESEYPDARPARPGAFPGLGSQAIIAYVLAARTFPDRAGPAMQTARAIGDWLLTHRTPADSAVAGLPYTAMRDGSFAHSAEGGAINVSRAAVPGYGMTLLFDETRDERYLAYARQVATVLISFLRDDGGMPYRVRPDSGAVVEPYTCGHALVGLFLDALGLVDPDDRWREASHRIRGWISARPMRDFNWKACYEDVGWKRRFANLTGMDAMWATRLLVRHAAEDPSRLPDAKKLFRWVEDQFVNFDDDVSLGRLRTFYPAVREQYHCDYPMEAHASNYASACREMYLATEEVSYRNKMTATLNAIVKSQRPDGAYSTWGRDRETGLGGFTSGNNWFSTNQTAAAELCRYILRVRGTDPLPF